MRLLDDIFADIERNHLEQATYQGNSIPIRCWGLCELQERDGRLFPVSLSNNDYKVTLHDQIPVQLYFRLSSRSTFESSEKSRGFRENVLENIPVKIVVVGKKAYEAYANYLLRSLGNTQVQPGEFLRIESIDRDFDEVCESEWVGHDLSNLARSYFAYSGNYSLIINELVCL